MRRDVAAAPSMQGVGVTPASLEAPRRRVGARLRELRLDRLELALLGAFGLVSLWVLGLDLWQVVVNGQVWTGTDGSYSTDQLQYLAWIQSASHHVLVSNLFVLHGTPADYFQPAVAISGLLVAAGLSPAVALLVWKPVAVIGVFAGVRAFARSAVPDAGRHTWAAIIALALFYGSFTVVYGSFGVLGDLFPGFLSWGYPFALMAIATAALAIVTYTKARSERRPSWTPGALGGLAGILHPWQGEVLLVTVILGELCSAEVRDLLRALLASEPRLATWDIVRAALGSPRLRLALATVAGTLLPLVYYLALDKLDLSWTLGRTASKHALATASIVVALAPLGLVALLGYRGPARTFTFLAARVWPAATIVVFFQSASGAGATPLHAFGGITLPLAVLAVEGCRRVAWPRVRRGRVLVVAVMLLATLPATGYELYLADVNARPTPGNANFITAGERQALDFLRHDPTPGGVLTRFYLGSAVPARTGRHTFVGDCIWSQPGCNLRDTQARELLQGQLPAAQARQFVASTGARFVLSDCRADADLTQDLQPLLVSVHRFGCAAVYQLS